MSTATSLPHTSTTHKRPPWGRIALAIAVSALLALYFTGRMDYALYPVGLNFHECARNGIGATFCGSDLTAYQQRWQGVQQQIQQSQQDLARQEQAAQQQAQQAQQALTQQECQADPSLSICP